MELSQKPSMSLSQLISTLQKKLPGPLQSMVAQIMDFHMVSEERHSVDQGNLPGLQSSHARGFRIRKGGGKGEEEEKKK